MTVRRFRSCLLVLALAGTIVLLLSTAYALRCLHSRERNEADPALVSTVMKAADNGEAEVRLLNELTHVVRKAAVNVRAVRDNRGVNAGGKDEEGGNGDEGSKGKCWVAEPGKRCRFPFRHQGVLYHSCVRFNAHDALMCAAAVDLQTGEATSFSKCMCDINESDLTSAAPGSPSHCSPKSCTCGSVLNFGVACNNSRVPCTDVCRERFRKPEEMDDSSSIPVLDAVYDAWDQAAGNVEAVKSLRPPAWDSVASNFRGTGLVMFTGGPRLPTAIASALFIRLELGSDLPIEIWHSEGELGPTQKMTEVCNAHAIYHRELPASHGVGRYRWETRWEKPFRTKDKKSGVETVEIKPVLAEGAKWTLLKPLIILLSSFDKVVFLDDDAVPTVDPVYLLSLLGSKSAVFWRDLWSLHRDATIWDVVPWPGKDETSFPSQDSGVVVVCKSCRDGEGWKGLVTAGYLNYRHIIYYPAIYNGGYGDTACKDDGCTAFGVGDKDTFLVGWLVVDGAFKMMQPAALVGPRPTSCGATLGQPGEDGILAVLHMNSHKLQYSDYVKGKWAKWWKRHRFCLKYVKQLKNPSDANFADGVRKKVIAWSGIPRSGAQRCLKFVKPSVSVPLAPMLNWDIETAIHKRFSATFDLEWITDYVGGLQS